MYIVLFVVFLNMRRWIFFCVGEFSFFYPLKSLNRFRICAGTPYRAPGDLQQQDRVIARFSCYSTKKISGHRTKFCQILSTHDFLVICLRCRTDKWFYVNGESFVLHVQFGILYKHFIFQYVIKIPRMWLACPNTHATLSFLWSNVLCLSGR